MNWHPLLKVCGILTLTWILFFIAQKSFEEPSIEHLNRIPAHADAVLILNNKKIGGALFYERFYHEDEFKSKVDIDEELEKELVADAIRAGIDLLSPIACFSYSSQNQPVVGMVLQASDKDDLIEFLKKYIPKTGLDFNFQVDVTNNSGLILFTEKEATLDLVEEIKDFNKKYESAPEQDWFKPLLSRDHDLAIFYNPHQNSGSVMVEYLNKITPSFVQSSYSFLSLNEDKLSISHQAQTTVDAAEILSSNKQSLNLEETVMSAEFHWNPEVTKDHSEETELFEFPVKDDIVEFALDSLMMGDVSLFMNGLSIKGSIIPTAEAVIAIRVDQNYWQSKKTELLAIGGMEDKGNYYQVSLGTALSALPIFLNEQEDFILISQRPDLLNQKLTSSSKNVAFKIDIAQLIENIDFIPIEDNWDIKTVTLNSISSEGNQLNFEGDVTFKHANHGIIDVLHMLTTVQDELDGLQISTFQGLIGVQ